MSSKSNKRFSHYIWAGIGQTVNRSKSKLYGLNIPTSLLRRFSIATGISIDSLPNTYVGLPVAQGGNLGEFWNKIHSKMKSMPGRWLSSAGWLTKINAIVAAVSIFWLSAFWVPQLMIDRMESTMHDFLCEGLSETKKIHLVTWDKICQSKSRGSLNIESLRDMNKALLGKQLWRIYQNNSSQWCKAYQSKYLDSEEPERVFTAAEQPLGSIMWNSLRKARTLSSNSSNGNLVMAPRLTSGKIPGYVLSHSLLPINS